MRKQKEKAKQKIEGTVTTECDKQKHIHFFIVFIVNKLHGLFIFKRKTSKKKKCLRQMYFVYIIFRRCRCFHFYCSLRQIAFRIIDCYALWIQILRKFDKRLPSVFKKELELVVVKIHRREFLVNYLILYYILC